MICSLYARKSTEQTGMSGKEKSVTRRIEHAKLYATPKDWAISDGHSFLDDGISGAEFVKHPGSIRLMNALKPRPAFQFLVMSEESRLGREQIETAGTPSAGVPHIQGFAMEPAIRIERTTCGLRRPEPDNCSEGESPLQSSQPDDTPRE